MENLFEKSEKELLKIKNEKMLLLTKKSELGIITDEMYNFIVDEIYEIDMLIEEKKFEKSSSIDSKKPEKKPIRRFDMRKAERINEENVQTKIIEEKLDE